jgi:hypothetical protein
MQRLRIDALKFTGAKKVTAKDGIEYIAIPITENNIFIGTKGAYLDLTLMDNRDGSDQYGNDGFITVDLGKDRRQQGEKGPIVGNWKHANTAPGQTVMPKTATPPPTPPKSGYEPDANDLTQDCPF